MIEMYYVILAFLAVAVYTKLEIPLVPIPAPGN